MNTRRLVCLLAACGWLAAGAGWAADPKPAPSAEDIAAKPELVVDAIKDQNAEQSAAIVLGALEVIFKSDASNEKKREQCIALVTYAVAAKGKDAADMMRLVAAGVPVEWLPLITATAAVAAGDNSPAVTKAILEAVGGDAQAADACRAAAANPSTVLLPRDMGVVRGIMLPTPSQAPAKAPPLPTIIQGADKYPGQ